MKNLVLITVDCLRYDALSPETAPNIMQLAEKGLFFERAYSLGCWTAPSLVGLLTSSYPLMYNGELVIKYPRVSIAQILHKNGYSTAGFTFHPYLSKQFGYHKGFDAYFDDIDEISNEHAIINRSRWEQLAIIATKMKKARLLRPIYSHLANRIYLHSLKHKLSEDFKFYVSGSQINELVIDWIKSHKEPFFVWIHYLDTHFPYIPEEDWDKREIIELNIERERWFRLNKPVNPEKLERLKQLYLTKVSDADRYIGNLIREFKKMGLYKDTVFVITADHGEEFYEHGGFHHDLKLYEELIHVPLIIFGDRIRSRKIKRVVSHIDLAPTLLDFLDIKKPLEWIGANMLLKKDSVAIIEEGQKERGDARQGSIFKLNLNAKKIAIVKGDWKYIYSKTQEEELYNLREDPREQKNLITSKNREYRHVLENMRKVLRYHLEMISTRQERILTKRILKQMIMKNGGD
ncbi:hypothetical protein EP1X_01250 [Thermococcus sp. EP1]|uniref:sulfatase n=1 Tax=Thermococcus sp. EP1 TaxID=1591054 RepID=UPI0006DBC391|nr:sulfatase [Thermococcus sp. EP1]KPU63854.1 hypothetical protein EP1X_01250 [Thermococcus sp. EP1]